MGLTVAAMLLFTLGAGRSPPDAIRARVLAFYRDDRAHHWPDVLDHFTVGKVAARWPTPTGDPRWMRAAPPDQAAPCVSSPADAPFRMSLAEVGRWARVFVTWCATGGTDEVWLVLIGADWRIARLLRDVPRLAYRAPFAPC